MTAVVLLRLVETLLAVLLPPEHNDPAWIRPRPLPSCTSDLTVPWCSRAARPLAFDAGCARRVAYNTSAARVPGGRVLNVHVVAHSHDDVGWLKTVDEYYYGGNQSIQVAGVQYILDGVVEQLLADKRRKFVYVETAFFARWWGEQDERMRGAVRGLVRDGQLGFANGGWVMSDEACAWYGDMIEQQTAGLRFLRRELGVAPTVGWQVDPFGHTGFMGTLYALMGMSSYGFGRIDYQDRAKREALKTLEVVQQPSLSLGPQSAVLAAAMRGYGPPKGFNWEWFDGADDPVQDDPALTGHNVRALVDAFVAAALEQAEHYAHCDEDACDVMFTMGSDFHYGNARGWFKNLDKLVHYVNADGRVNALYAQPDGYFGAKLRSARAWPIKTDDFLPYSDGDAAYEPRTDAVVDLGGHAFWTGYYTSRPALKAHVRMASRALHVCRQLELLAPDAPAGRRAPDGRPSSAPLWLALSVAQHHDAVSGTARQHVTNDYQRSLSAGVAECDALVADAYARLLPAADAVDEARAGAAGALADVPTPSLAFARCALNESACERTAGGDAAAGRSVRVVAYNALAQARPVELVRVPVPAGADVSATADSGMPLGVQLLPAASDAAGASAVALVRVLGTPAVGLRSFELSILPPLRPQQQPQQPQQQQQQRQTAASAFAPRADGLVTLRARDGLVALSLEVSDGGRSARVVRLDADGGVSCALAVALAFYPAHDGNTTTSCGAAPVCRNGQASGAYIFRPNCTEGAARACAPSPIGAAGGRAALVALAQGGALCEVATLSFAPWANLSLAVCEGERALRVDWSVGPVPVADGIGKEVVLRYDSDLATAGSFATDSNGRDMQRRARDARETWRLNVTDPVAGNYYPVTALLVLAEPRRARAAGARQPAARQLSVHVDRAQGGSSLADGSAELMLHRRLLRDDNRGVAEPLDERSRDGADGLAVRGTHWVQLAAADSAMRAARAQMQRVQYPLDVRFGRPQPLRAPAPPPVARAAAAAAVGADGFLASELDSQLHLLSAHDLTQADVPSSGDATARACDAHGEWPPGAAAPSQLLLRLAHSVGAEEGGTPVRVHLGKLFAQLRLDAVREVLVSAHAPARPVRAAHAPFKTASPLPAALFAPVRGAPTDMDVVISPLEIRTWLANFTRTPVQ